MQPRPPHYTPQDLEALVGSELGVSSWLTVTQEAVDEFARCTGDHNWIHVDQERASASPFGATIAHGFFTLALASQLLPQVVQVAGSTHGLNYGLNRVRFPAPLRVGDPVRLRVRLEEMELAPDSATLTLGLNFETAHDGKPVCVASWIVREYVSSG